MKSFRKFFPILQKRRKIVYLDSVATSLKPEVVVQSVKNYYEKYSINSHSYSNNFLSKKVEMNIKKARSLIAKIIGAKKEEVIFSPSATYSLNVLSLSLKNYLKKGDKICLTYLEHSSNCHPWQEIAWEKGAEVDFLPLNEKIVIDINKIEKHVDKRTRIVSFCHISNSLGVVNPVSEISEKIKKINPSCRIIIDACQSIAHLPINVKKWGIDALVFSGHKVYGPTGIGILWIKEEFGRNLPDLLWGGGKNKETLSKINNIPLSQKFEVGTLPLAQIFGIKKAFEFFDSIKIEVIISYEKMLKNYLLKELIRLEEIIIYNQNLETIDIVLFNLKNFHAHDVADYLGKHDIYVRSGNFCCPYLHKIIGVESAIRVSLFIYNTTNDIDNLVYQLRLLLKNPELIINF